MGLVLIGIGSVGITHGEKLTSAGLSGAAMQLFTHGTITAVLFLATGLIYDKARTRYIPDLGGLANRMPLIATAFLIAGLASLGLPGLSGFVSELLVFMGAFKAYPWPTALAVLGIIQAAGYILWMLERSLFGPDKKRFAEITDASIVEAIPLMLLVASIVAVGLYPAFLIDVFQRGLEPMMTAFNGGAG
jgi:NADH-quinone oxidoreductase subunit M